MSTPPHDLPLVPDPDGSSSPPSGKWRRIAIWIGWAKTAIAVLLALSLLLASGDQDPAGAGMAGGLAAFALLYLLLFVAPGLALAYKTERVGLALSLLLLPDVLVLLAIGTL